MSIDEHQLRIAAERMKQMDPENMRRQAQMLRNMDPNMVRQSNPQMANFSDAQIQEAADQMEQMANDPALIQQAAAELNKMSPEQMADMKRMVGGGTLGADGGAPQQPPQQTFVAGGFPIGTRVVLKDLVAAAEFNGKSGVVKEPLRATGRQNVFVEGVDKQMLLKPANLEPEPRELKGLSVEELQSVLKAKGVDPKAPAHAKKDAAQLRDMVEEELMPDDELSVLIAEGEAKAGVAGLASTAAENLSSDQLRKGADAMAQMQPERMRAQAAALRNMDPEVVRRSNPQMANFSDAQIQQAADQMEMMASNPDMMRMAAQQMRNMTPEQMAEMRRMVANGQSPGMPPAGGAPAGSGGNGAGAAAAGAPGGGMPAAMSPDALMQMDPKQLKSMLNMVKDNPAMIKQMMQAMPGAEQLGEEGIKKQFDALAAMDEKQLESFLTMAGTAKRAMDTAKGAWDKVDRLFFGQLKRVLILSFALLVAVFVKWLFFFSPAEEPMADSFSTFSDYAANKAADAAGAPPHAANTAAGVLNGAAETISAAVGADGDVEDEFDLD